MDNGEKVARSPVSKTVKRRPKVNHFEGIGVPEPGRPLGLKKPKWGPLNPETPQRGFLTELDIYQRAMRLSRALVGVCPDDRRLIWMAAAAGATVDLRNQHNRDLLKALVKKKVRETRGQTYAGERQYDIKKEG